MKRIPQPSIRKYCRDQRFTITYNRPYSNTEYRFRITNIKSEYKYHNPLKAEFYEDIILNIVVDGTVSHTTRDGRVYDVKELAEDLKYLLDYDPRGPRKNIRRILMSGIGRNSYYYGTSRGANPLALFLKCMNMGEQSIKLGTITFGKV